jgi:aspartate aminotransferase
MNNMQGQATNGICTLAQAAAIAALDGPQDLLKERAEIYRERRDFVVEQLSQAPGVLCHKPEGAFYVFPNIAGCIGRTSKGGARSRPTPISCSPSSRNSMSRPCRARPMG